MIIMSKCMVSHFQFINGYVNTFSSSSWSSRRHTFNNKGVASSSISIFPFLPASMSVFYWYIMNRNMSLRSVLTFLYTCYGSMSTSLLLHGFKCIGCNYMHVVSKNS